MYNTVCTLKNYSSLFIILWKEMQKNKGTAWISSIATRWTWVIFPYLVFWWLFQYRCYSLTSSCCCARTQFSPVFSFVWHTDVRQVRELQMTSRCLPVFINQLWLPLASNLDVKDWRTTAFGSLLSRKEMCFNISLVYNWVMNQWNLGECWGRRITENMLCSVILKIKI